MTPHTFPARVNKARLVSFALAFCALYLDLHSVSAQYTLTITDYPSTPAVSVVNKPGDGATPCNFTFNPSWLQRSATFNETGLLVRAANCPSEYGGSNDHIMFVPCTADGRCGDLKKGFQLPSGSEDPRVIFYNDTYYNFYYFPGAGQNTVRLDKTKTPLNASSWQHVATLPWHRNGCVLLRDQPPHYVLFGEGPDPLPGIGMAITYDMETFKTINSTFLLPQGPNEIKLEAGTPPVQLSTGDYLHFYAAATPGWIPNGNYTAGWIVLDKDDPTKIVQRSDKHILIPTKPFEQGIPPYPVNRHNVIFLCSAVPTGNTDEFRLWFGGADASVGTAVVKAMHDGHDGSRV